MMQHRLSGVTLFPCVRPGAQEVSREFFTNDVNELLDYPVSYTHLVIQRADVFAAGRSQLRLFAGKADGDVELEAVIADEAFDRTLCNVFFIECKISLFTGFITIKYSFYTKIDFYSQRTIFL